MRASRNWWCVSLAAAVVAATLGFPRITVSAGEPKAAGAATLHTATVTRGNVVATVEAVGTMEPEQVVDVGSQVCGSITDLLVDYGSQVEKGALLAKIDDTLYVAQVEQARIGCQRADAEVALAKAKSSLAKLDWQRAQELIKHNAISSFDYDVAKYNYEVAQASIAVAEAASAQSKFALKQAEINLDWTRIRSPVKGVVIDRRVNVGQTVVSDNGVISAASLFLIAKDLKNLQVWVSVNEADIGKIRKEQTVRFTVDAYPGQSFTGKVAQIRLNATMTQDIVTYTVVVPTDNANEKLLPYMTANVQFEVQRRKDVLRVPNAALHWRPQPQWIAADVREKALSDSRESARPRQEPYRVWVQDGRFVRPFAVKIGLSDGAMTEILSGDVTEGMKVIVGGSIAMTDLGGGATTGRPSITSQLPRSAVTSSAAKKAMQKAIASMGTNQLLVLPGATAGAGISFGSGSATTLTPQDADVITRLCPAVSDAAPIVRGRAQIVYGSRNWVSNDINGTTPSFLAVRDWEELAEGAAFTDADVRNANKVCLIGDTLKRELFQGDSPVGKQIRIRNVAFQVVGVLGHKGANIMGTDQDDIVLAPWTTVAYR